MREEEWAIDSGMVENGGKQYKTRFCGQRCGGVVPAPGISYQYGHPEQTLRRIVGQGLQRAQT